MQTERLLLRPLEAGDVELLWPYVSDPEVSRYMAWQAHSSRSETAEFIRNEILRRESGQGITWAIFLGTSFCGIVSLIGIVRQHRGITYNKAELAFWLAAPFRGHGIMTEAARRALEYGVRDLNLHKIVVSHRSDNGPSERLASRLGFRYLAEAIEHVYKDGSWHNEKFYELLDREFLGAHTKAER